MKKLLVLLVLLVPAAAFAAVDFSFPSPAIPTITFNEESSGNVDLDNYISGIDAGEQLVGFTIKTQGSKTTATIGSGNVLTVTGKTNANGADTVTVSATVQNSTNSSDKLTKDANVAITINNVNDAPTISLPDKLKVTAGQQYTYDVSKVAKDVDNDQLTYSVPADLDWASFSINSASGIITINADETEVGDIYPVKVTVTDPSGANASDTVDFFVTEQSDDGSLVINEFELEDITDDDSELLPGDEITVDFDVENKLSIEITDIEVTAWIQDSSGKKLGDEIELDSFDLDDKDSDSLSTKLRIPPDAEAETHYLVLQAVGEDENDTERSAMYIESLDVERNDNDVFIDTVTVNPSPVLCGNSVDITVDIWNTGTKDEDAVKLRVRNTALGIDVSTEIFELNDKGSDAEAVKTISVVMPGNIKGGNQSLEVIASYKSGKETESTFVNVDVICSGTATTVEQPSGTAALTVSTKSVEGQQGEPLKIVATIENTGDDTVTYMLELTGISDWASGSVQPDTVTLSAGASAGVTVTITPKASATGTQTAVLNVKSNNVIIDSETISVKLGTAPKTTIMPLSFLKGSENTTLFLLLIGILAAFAIIVAGKKMATGSSVEVYGKKRR